MGEQRGFATVGSVWREAVFSLKQKERFLLPSKLVEMLPNLKLKLYLSLFFWNGWKSEFCRSQGRNVHREWSPHFWRVVGGCGKLQVCLAGMPRLLSEIKFFSYQIVHVVRFTPTFGNLKHFGSSLRPPTGACTWQETTGLTSRCVLLLVQLNSMKQDRFLHTSYQAHRCFPFYEPLSNKFFSLSLLQAFRLLRTLLSCCIMQ